MGLRENRDCKQGNGLLLAHDPQMVEELHVYCGREQQKRGTVLASVQQFVFGETLPRGHGHRGRISTLMSSLFDEITGRTPRKRRATVTPTSRRWVVLYRLDDLFAILVHGQTLSLLL